jgi:Family of unknown function (DUF5989)
MRTLRLATVFLEVRIVGMAKLALLGEFWEFLKVRKKWWLAPIISMLVLLGALIFLSQGSAVAPFIYTLF